MLIKGTFYARFYAQTIDLKISSEIFRYHEDLTSNVAYESLDARRVSHKISNSLWILFEIAMRKPSAALKPFPLRLV